MRMRREAREITRPEKEKEGLEAEDVDEVDEGEGEAEAEREGEGVGDGRVSKVMLYILSFPLNTLLAFGV